MHRIQAREIDTFTAYLRNHPHVTDVLFTGGDPMVMNARLLERYVAAILAIQTVLWSRCESAVAGIRANHRIRAACGIHGAFESLARTHAGRRT